MKFNYELCKKMVRGYIKIHYPLYINSVSVNDNLMSICDKIKELLYSGKLPEESFSTVINNFIKDK